MNKFTELCDLPIYNLYEELSVLISGGIITWPKDNSQICLNTVRENSNDYTLGVGSLAYDWSNSKEEVDEVGNKKIVLNKFENPLLETDFKFLCNQFKGTLFEKAYNSLSKKYNLGRVRIMKSSPKTCLSWHTDNTPRIHYPIKTQEGCFMVIEDEVRHLEKNKWYLTNTTVPHTAFNSSKEDRIHLVACIL